MRAAPAVDAALGQGRIERMLITALHAGAGAFVSVWAAAHVEAAAGHLSAGLPWFAGLAGALGLGAVGVCLARRALPRGSSWLSWDGAVWQWRGERPDEGLAPLQRVVVSLDQGAWVLLQLVPAGGAPARWQVASARGVGAAWHGLRVALQAHAGDPRLPGDETPDRRAQGPGAPP